jgi:hypothetical protein
MPSLNLARIGALVAVGSVGFVLSPTGCVGGWTYSGVPEGDRCNPYDSHNECASGLACTVSSYQVNNMGGTSNLGTPELALAEGAGMDSQGNFLVLQFCPENYCCPVDSNGDLAPSGNPNCQPGCNGGAAAICAAVAGMEPSYYTGVCDFANGVVPDGGSDAGAPEAAAPEAAAPEAAAPEAAAPEAAAPEAAAPEAAAPEASTLDGGDGG